MPEEMSFKAVRLSLADWELARALAVTAGCTAPIPLPQDIAVDHCWCRNISNGTFLKAQSRHIPQGAFKASSRNIPQG
jgi:hypothetical protein